MEYFQKNTDTKKEINQIKATLIERITLLSDHPCSGGQSFQSLLIQPVQRITRYVLLLGVCSCIKFGGSY
jgi:hypothetical protein